jgi:hypothetical protein
LFFGCIGISGGRSIEDDDEPVFTIDGCCTFSTP